MVKSGCYSVLGYKTAWLSYYYPLEFAYACLKVYDDSNKKNKCVSIAKKRGVKILPPDINKSKAKFDIYKENGKNVALVYGLSDIEGIGDKASYIICAEREANGDYKDLYDFVDRLITNKTDTVINIAGRNKKGGVNSVINRTHVNALIKAGAFDYAEENRFKYLNIYNSQINTNGSSSWEMLDENSYVRANKLQYEKEALKNYVSEHPLEPFPYVDFDVVADYSNVIFTGIVKSKKTKKTKNGKNYLNVIAELKDSTEISINLWATEKKAYEKIIKAGEILIFHGQYSAGYRNVTCRRIQEIEVKGTTANIDSGDIDKMSNPIPVLEAPEFDMLEAFANITEAQAIK